MAHGGAINGGNNMVWRSNRCGVAAWRRHGEASGISGMTSIVA